MKKTKVVLDADVIIHFHKGGCLSSLPSFLEEFDFVVLKYVYDEVLPPTRNALNNQINFLKNITLIEDDFIGEIAHIYALLRRNPKMGKGESACMAYCQCTQNVIGSSNTRDIKEYCIEHQITYLTTWDFLYYAWVRHKMSEDDIANFVSTVNAQGSILPSHDLHTYVPSTQI